MFRLTYASDSKQMLLALDIGNTNIKIGVFADEAGDEPYMPAASWRINTERGRTADEYGLMTSNMLPTRGVDVRDVTSVAMCSGVPSLTSAFVEVSETYFGQSPLVVGAGVKTGIRDPCTTIRGTSGPTGSWTRRRRSSCTAGRPSLWTSGQGRCSTRRPKTASISAGQ